MMIAIVAGIALIVMIFVFAKVGIGAPPDPNRKPPATPYEKPEGERLRKRRWMSSWWAGV